MEGILMVLTVSDSIEDFEVHSVPQNIQYFDQWLLLSFTTKTLLILTERTSKDYGMRLQFHNPVLCH